jgi:mannose-6-phosphate isomerase-like protein (cupin superfamily)
MKRFHQHDLPDHSTLLSGNTPRDDFGFQSEQLQIWYNNTDESWLDEREKPHMHTTSDECFIVLNGTLVVEVEGKRFSVGPRQYCCFPCGSFHAILEIRTPIESFMIRAPSIDDKVYQNESTKDGS